jgi:glutaredoxin-like protein NrdH
MGRCPALLNLTHRMEKETLLDEFHAATTHRLHKETLMVPKITVYALSTCVHCQHAKEYLQEHAVPFESIQVDGLFGPEKSDTMYALGKLNPALTFPTIVIGDKVIVGFRREELENALKECAQK